MSSSVVVKRVAVNRERSSRPYTRTELAACCTARCCLLLLPAGLFDDLSNGLFDRLSDCPYDLPLIPPHLPRGLNTPGKGPLRYM